jgi:4-amino-4-deoxy-L-arabinose transferase-like glycosyltransferase
VSLLSLGAAPLERAEIYFLDAARAMVERDDHLVPHYRGEPFFDKPALAYWLMAAAFHAFGPSAEAARLVSALFALLTVLLTGALARRLLGPAAAGPAALVLATTPAFMSFSRVAMSDMLLVFFSTLAFLLGLLAYEDEKASWASPALGAALGLGFLAKGPIAVLVPGLGLLALAWTRRRERWPWRGREVALALAVFAVLGLGWFGAVFARLGAAPLRYFFLRENLERFAGATYDSAQPFWYYLPTYLAQGAPWALFLPWAAFAARRDGGRAGALLLLGWAGLVVALLGSSRGKIDYYLLPVYPALSCVVGSLFTREWGRAGRRWAGLVTAGLCLTVTALPWVLRGVPTDWLPPARSILAAAALWAVVALGLLAAALRPAPGRTLLALGGGGAVVFSTLAGVFLPAFRAGQPNDAIVRAVARERYFEPAARVALCHDLTRVDRDLLFQSRLATEERCDVWAMAAATEPYLMLVPPSQVEPLVSAGVRAVSRFAHLPATVLTLGGFEERARPRQVVLVANYPAREPEVARLARRARRRAVLEAAEP